MPPLKIGAMPLSFQHIISLFSVLPICLTAAAQSDYTLRQALQTARVNNSVLKTARFDPELAQADLTATKLFYNPVLGMNYINVAAQKYAEPGSGLYSTVNSQYAFQLGKPFQIAGQRKNAVSAAQKTVAFTEQKYTETERNLFSEVAAKWLEIWTAQKQLDMLTTAKSNIDSLVISNQLRYKNQVITQTDLFRTQLLSKQYAIQHKTALQEVSNRQNELKFLLGVQEHISIDTSDNFLFAIPEDIDSLLTQSLQNRSDILTAKAMLEVSNSNIKLQKSLAFPQPELGFIWNPQNTIPYFGIYVALDLPFFNRNQGEIKKSYLLKAQSEQHLITVQSQLQTEIKIAYESYRLQQRNLEDFKSVLEQSQTVLDHVKYHYLKGGTTVIDFLEAQRSWLETQQHYYDALQQYRQSYIQLLYATGLINQLAQ